MALVVVSLMSSFCITASATQQFQFPPKNGPDGGPTGAIPAGAIPAVEKRLIFLS